MAADKKIIFIKHLIFIALFLISGIKTANAAVNFSLSQPNPDKYDVNPGDTKIYTIKTAGNGGFTDPITISVSSVVSLLTPRESDLSLQFTKDGIFFSNQIILNYDLASGEYEKGYLYARDAQAGDLRGDAFWINIEAAAGIESDIKTISLYINKRPKAFIHNTTPISGTAPLTVSFKDGKSSGAPSNAGGELVGATQGINLVLYMADLDDNGLKDHCFSKIAFIDCNNILEENKSAPDAMLDPTLYDWTYTYTSNVKAKYSVFDDLVEEYFLNGELDKIDKSMGTTSIAVNIIGNQSPSAVAEISIDEGNTYSNMPTVEKNTKYAFHFSADKSSDPNGWTNPNGVSNGGKCEWNIDLTSPTTFQSAYDTISPAAPSSCNQNNSGKGFQKTFTNVPAVYPFEVLKITDNNSLSSNLGRININVVPKGTTPSQKMSVTKAGTGTGFILSSPAIINCGVSCLSASADFAINSIVTLTATPNIGSNFIGWNGCSSEISNSIDVNLTADKICTAVFDLNGSALNDAPMAEASIIVGGLRYSYNIPLNVTKGVPVTIESFEADFDINGDKKASYDPDGWTDSLMGVSSGGGKCEWDYDFDGNYNADTSTVNPPDPGSCNEIKVDKIVTFNTEGANQEFEILKITDRGGLSGMSKIRVNVNNPGFCMDDCSPDMSSWCVTKHPGTYTACGNFDADLCLDFSLPPTNCRINENCIQSGTEAKCTAITDPIITFTANPPEILTGTSSFLEWTAQNMSPGDTCIGSSNPVYANWDGTAANSSKSAAGNENISPPKTTEFTLMCENAFGTDSETVNVKIIGSPSPKEALNNFKNMLAGILAIFKPIY